MKQALGVSPSEQIALESRDQSSVSEGHVIKEWRHDSHYPVVMWFWPMKLFKCQIYQNFEIFHSTKTNMQELTTENNFSFSLNHSVDDVCLWLC